MNLRSLRLSLGITAAIATAALLTACGGGGGGGGNAQSAANLTGVAATGAPVVGATLTAMCGNNASYTGTTSMTGSFALTVPSANFPCALQISGGNLPAAIPALYSLATSSGNTNVTPLTDLALALQINTAFGQTLTQWFASPSNLDAIALALAAASDTLRTALTTAGYTIPASWSAGSTAPFTAAFTPNPASDPFDQLLESLANAISGSGALANYTALRNAMVGGGTLPVPTTPTTPTIPVGLQPTGDGSALAGVNGATGTLNGTTRTYTANVGWDTFGGTTGTFGAYKPDGASFDGITRWHIEGLPATVGIHRCKSDQTGLLPRVMLMTGGGAGYTSGECVIEVTSVTNGTITGRFATELIDLWGDGRTIAGTVTDGYFTKAAAVDGVALPAGEIGASFKVGAVTYRYLQVVDLSYDEFAGMSALPGFGEEARSSPGFPNGIQIHTVPNQVGTYACDSHQGNVWRKVNIWFYWNSVVYSAGARQSSGSGPVGSSCSITVTRVLPNFEGSFSGTFVNSEGASITVTDGLFRRE
jgi:hypothetical protein